MLCNYFTVIERIDGFWSPQYGSYDHTDCRDEIACMRESGTKRKDLKIIATPAGQKHIDAAIRAINIGL